VSWRDALAEMDGGEAVVQSMLAEAGSDPAAEHEGAVERLLIKAARAGNPLSEEQVARLRLALRRGATTGGVEPAWRQMVEAAPSMLAEAA